MRKEELFLSVEELKHVQVERALHEFRSARPVLVRSGGSLLLAFPVEGLSNELVTFLKEQRSARLVTPLSKPNDLNTKDAIDDAPDGFSAAVSPLDAKTLAELLRASGTDFQAASAALRVGANPPSLSERAALVLAHLALLLPAVVVCESDSASDFPLVSVDADAVLSFRDLEAESLRIIARAPVPLEGAEQSEFVIFRGGDGFREQIAVIIGEPSARQPVLVRIHSACLTGDLFGSLKCDCGEQLRGTARVMAEQGGGVVLYLDQEGRGNGIANKIRAYGLQAEGHDTYEADRLLGFGLDQRRFDFAASMLKQLGYTSIRLMTNNPHKIDALREAGLDVVSTHRVIPPLNAHNVKYLTAKRDKAGHMLDELTVNGFDGDAATHPVAANS